MATCSVPGCEREHWGRGYCRGHCARVQRHGDPQADRPLQQKTPNGPRCSVDGCHRRPHAHSLCSGHLTRLSTHGDVLADRPVAPRYGAAVCPAAACGRQLYANGLCRLHDRRVKTHGDVELPERPQQPCGVATCGRPARVNGYCGTHAERLRRNGTVDEHLPIRRLRADEPCDLDGCDRPHYCLGFCVNHYQQRVSRPRRKALEDTALGDVDATRLQARIDYFGGRCWMCRAPWQCIDHVKPLSRGGSNWPSNLRPACTSCNARKHNRWPYPVTTTTIRKAA